jgi:23S rRNA pseudouridine1911/1915/1917 synthase
MLRRVAVTDEKYVGMRLDLFLANQFAGMSEMKGVSRSGIQRMIAEGEITLNGQKTKAGNRLKPGDEIEICRLPVRDTVLAAEPLPLDILYEDQDCVVVNKAPGMVVHQAAGNRRGTLVNALLYHCPDLQGVGGERRPGIVHRLDKDTSGVMVIAKNDHAFQRLALQFKERLVEKEYLALVWGKPVGEQGVIDRPIGRHRRDRKRMSSLHFLSRHREALTAWRAKVSYKVRRADGRLSWVTFLRLKPHTGRTHQIRVHLADQGHPVVGDRIYSRTQKVASGNSAEVPDLIDFPRQALHAEKLRFNHPRTGRRVEFCAPLPGDLRRLLERLAEHHLLCEKEGKRKKRTEG